MTLASLVVKLSVDAADFHRDMEAVGRRVEMTGRQIARAGHELSIAVSLPILAQGFLAFYAVLQRSTVSFGPLYQAFEQLKGSATSLYVQLGTVLEPVFLKMIASLEGTIAWVKSLIVEFQHLSPAVQKVIIDVLLFLAYLGPTVLVIGKLIGALGAIPKLIGLLTSATGLWVIGILALVAGLAFVATHWDQTKLQLVLAWTFIEEKVFDAIDGILSGIGFLVDAFPILSKAVASVQNDFEAWSDGVLARSAVAIQKLQHEIALLASHHKTLGDTTSALQKVSDTYLESMREMGVLATGVGATFDFASAQAAILKTAIDGANAAHLQLGETIPGVNMTLEQSIHLWQALTAQGSAFATASQAFGSTLAQQAVALKTYQDLLKQGLSEQQAAEMTANLGSHAKAAMAGVAEAFGGTAQAVQDSQKMFDALVKTKGMVAAVKEFDAFKDDITTVLSATQSALEDSFVALGAALGGAGGNLGKSIGKIFSNLLVTTGTAMIAYGVALIPLQKLLKNIFAENPVAAIAAGVGLVALGSALGGAVQGAANTAIATGGGGGGGASASTGSSYSATQDTGPVIVQFPKGSHIYDATDPDQVERFREFFQNLTGRDVLMQVA